jgi:hypothetical protein
MPGLINFDQKWLIGLKMVKSWFKVRQKLVGKRSTLVDFDHIGPLWSKMVPIAVKNSKDYVVWKDPLTTRVHSFFIITLMASKRTYYSRKL